MIKTADLDPQRFEQIDIRKFHLCEFWRKNVWNAACIGDWQEIYSIVIETTSCLITMWYCAGTIFCVPILTESSLPVLFAVLLLKELTSQRWAVLLSQWFSLGAVCFGQDPFYVIFFTTYSTHLPLMDQMFRVYIHFTNGILFIVLWVPFLIA